MINKANQEFECHGRKKQLINIKKFKIRKGNSNFNLEIPYWICEMNRDEFSM